MDLVLDTVEASHQQCCKAQVWVGRWIWEPGFKALGLGALFAALALISGLDIWTVATLALPFLVDVLMTLIWRTKHGRNLLDPHLDHAYQRLIASGWSHLDVAILYWGFSAVSGAAAYIAAQGGGAAPFAVFWGLCLAGIMLWVRHRRTAE